VRDAGVEPQVRAEDVEVVPGCELAEKMVLVILAASDASLVTVLLNEEDPHAPGEVDRRKLPGLRPRTSSIVEDLRRLPCGIKER
jgi:hypothetical protein